MPRNLLSEFLAMPEASRVAVYYLFGEGVDDEQQCYIGQTGTAGSRLKQHAKDESKGFWTSAIVAVSSTNHFTSTHVALLEWLSIDAASKFERYKLVNGNTGSRPHTLAPQEEVCAELFETISILLSTLGRRVLEPRLGKVQAADGETTAAAAAAMAAMTGEPLFFREGGCEGRGVQTPEGLLVQAGSTGRLQVRPSAPAALAAQREALVREGVVSYDIDRITFLKDYLFSSASGAGSFLVGGTQNGRISWRNAAGKNLHQIEADLLDAASPTPEV